MLPAAVNKDTGTTTSYKVVLPFYSYASLAFLVATILLALSPGDFLHHYFHPHALAITHVMALGWGTMMILGASHQLIPVLIESGLYSDKLAITSFLLAATGIPLLVYGFYVFNVGWPAQYGGILVVMAVIIYLINLMMSMSRSKQENVHAYFILTAALWLLATAVVGLVLVYNFTYSFMPVNSIDYLPLHAHIGIVGWFLLLIIGVGSRLIPMFLISKYSNPKMLWLIYGLINGGLLCFVVFFLYIQNRTLLLIPLVAITGAIALFGRFCYCSYQQRIRKKLDEPMKVSMFSVLMMLLPVIFLAVIIVLLALSSSENTSLVVAYGFIIFFGWITAIILGMTFKTLPFIIWNKEYHHLAGKGKTPNPKDLFSDTIFKWMSILYVAGFVLFATAILLKTELLLQTASLLLLLTSILYNWNVIKLLAHKPVSE